MVIRPESATPVYVQVANILRDRITSGQLQRDTPLPSETQILQEFGVARGTARKAIKILRDEGLVVTVKGRGSYVRP
jgi:GntR family transcriptional regulator